MFRCSDPGRQIECQLADTVTFIPDVRYGRVVKVYDGDTITIGAKLYPVKRNSPIYRFSVRLNGIDTPEIKGSGPEEHHVAILARDWLSNKIMGKMVYLDNVKFEKYGRLLATVYLVDTEKIGYKKLQWTRYHREKTCLNQQMIDPKFAVSYDGGTKQQIDWKQYYEGDNYDDVGGQISQV
mgnify:CR=1 FL=1